MDPMRKLAIKLHPSIKDYKYEEIEAILKTEGFGVDSPISDTGFSAFMLACSLKDDTVDQKAKNLQNLKVIWNYGPNLTYVDIFNRTALYIARKAKNLTAATFILNGQTDE